MDSELTLLRSCALHQDMGSFSGFPLSHLEENGHKFPEDAETMKAMRLRGQEFWESIIVPLAQAGEGGTVGLVSHGAFRACLFCPLSESTSFALTLLWPAAQSSTLSSTWSKSVWSPLPPLSDRQNSQTRPSRPSWSTRRA